MKHIFILSLSMFTLSAFAQKPKKILKKLGADPVFFIDSINVDRSEIIKYKPEEIATVSQYTDDDATKLVGPDGKDGVVYIETKFFAKNKYWNFFKTKSVEYANIVLTPESDSTVQYILNDRVLKTNFEGELSLINDSIFKEIRIIDNATLQKEFNITGKLYGVIIKSDKPANLTRSAKRKF